MVHVLGNKIIRRERQELGKEERKVQVDETKRRMFSGAHFGF